ncbi:DUF2834 domain-containing protein [Perlucidibaca aquatica]|uniref:DUF2834 domain-containing protein n=1 Tax=Perlucidibaca aquatica TaxID=1852776 RepID=UPI00083AFCA0|nr:DUF2834 domain-containing protein [Perlucidibaca aquatica]
MSEKTYFALLAAIATLFSVFFALTVIPALMLDWDIISALAAGFVNPFAAGYSTDVILCWCVLVIWVLYERKAKGIQHGWVCLVLGAVPGVAVGFALYLILRAKQLSHRE